MNTRARREIWAVAGITLALAAVAPLLHLSFLLCAPEDTMPSFIHTGDSAHHICAMRSWSNGFDSPYASAESPWGGASWRYYMVPFFLLYGFIGALLRPLGLSNFLGLGLLNGAALALMLLAAYRLLRAMAPRHALRAWLLFTVGGGIGGIAWVLASAGVPWVSNDGVLYRLGLYELLDVQSLRPHALAARLYYTLPLALGFLGLARCIRDQNGWVTIVSKTIRGNPLFGKKEGSPRPPPRKTAYFRCRKTSTSSCSPGNRNQVTPKDHKASALPILGISRSLQAVLHNSGLVTVFLFAGAAFINPRLGPMLWLVAVLRPLAIGAAPWRWIVAPTVGTAGGFACGVFVLTRHPNYLENVGAIAQDVAHPVALLAAALPLWFVVVPRCWRVFAGLPALPRYLSGALMGFLVAYGALYVAHQCYYGTFILGAGPYGGEAAAAVFVSGWALLGIFPGLLLARWHASPVTGTDEHAGNWATLWLLAFLALALSAGPGGWAMRLAPERFLVLLGLPLALLAAQALESWRPKARGAFLAGALACGVLSVLGWAYVNGPWPGTFRDGGLFPHVRYGLMDKADFAAMKRLTPGRVAVLSAPELRVADMAAVRGGVSVLHGIGTMNISDRLYRETALAEAVLLKAEDEIAMARVVRDFAVDFILVSGTAPPPNANALCARLDGLPWLEPVGPFTGSLYRVLPAHLPVSAPTGE